MGGGNIKQDSSYRMVTDINITTWNNKANSSHSHDDRYYTENEVDTKLNAKANSSHTHGWDSIVGNIAVPSKAGTIALTDDLNTKGTWPAASNTWFPGYNLYGMGYVFIIPVTYAGTNIAVSAVSIFTGSGWHDTKIITSCLMANQYIFVCENSNIDGLEYGKVYLTRATIQIS